MDPPIFRVSEVSISQTESLNPVNELGRYRVKEVKSSLHLCRRTVPVPLRDSTVGAPGVHIHTPTPCGTLCGKGRVRRKETPKTQTKFRHRSHSPSSPVCARGGWECPRKIPLGTGRDYSLTRDRRSSVRRRRRFWFSFTPSISV